MILRTRFLPVDIDPDASMVNRLLSLAVAATAFVARSAAQSFTVAGGQIYTPGLAIVNSPQPGTPMGGDTIEVSLDVTTNGKLPLPAQLADDSPTRIYNITIFMSSYATGRNFTMTNGTASGLFNASLGDIMQQEPGSSVKHVKWRWPDCLVGDGQPRDTGSARGAYNISIRQNFRLNGVNHYTVFDLPISVTNRIDADILRPACDDISNPLLPPEQIDAVSANAVGVLFAPGSATQLDVKADPNKDKNGLGSAQQGNGIDSGAMRSVGGELGWMCGLVALAMVVVV